MFGIQQADPSAADSITIRRQVFDQLMAVVEVASHEINDIRGVRGAGALKTLLHRKLIARVARKDRPGRAALYKTTRQFLIEFGLNRVDELFTSERFAEILRLPQGLGADKARHP